MTPSHLAARIRPERRSPVVARLAMARGHLLLWAYVVAYHAWYFSTRVASLLQRSVSGWGVREATPSNIPGPVRRPLFSWLLPAAQTSRPAGPFAHLDILDRSGGRIES